MKLERMNLISGSMIGMKVPLSDDLEVVKPGSLAVASAGMPALQIRNTEDAWDKVVDFQGVDPFKNDIALLMNFEGTPGTNTFTDDSGQLTFSAHRGWPVFDTTRTLYRPTSMRIGTSGNGLRPVGSTVHPAWLLGTKTFTIEAWVWLDSVNGKTNFIYTHWIGGISTECCFIFHVRPGGQLAFSYGINTINARLDDTSEFRVKAGEWQHIAITRVGRNVTFFVNGKKGSTELLPSTSPINSGSTAGPAIGCVTSSGGTGNGLVGNIGQLCVTWAERYTEDFIPNTAHYAYP